MIGDCDDETSFLHKLSLTDRVMLWQIIHQLI